MGSADSSEKHIELTTASEEDRSNKPVRRRFSLRNESLNESSDQSNVPTGLQMFSAYRKGILNPDIVNTQPSASTSKVAEQSSAKITEPRIPATWLKPRGALSRLLNGHVPPVTSDPSTSNLASLNSQKIPYDPQTTPTKSGPPTNSKKLLVSSRQRGNPLLELIRHVVWEYAEIGPDYVFGPSQCGFFLSLRYHNINPGYIFERLQKLTSNYQLIVLIVLVDVDDAHHPLKELNKFGLTQNVTVLLAWSFLEAARYIESFKALVNKPPEELQSEAATASIQKDHFTLATDFLTSLRVVSRTDAATLLSRFGAEEVSDEQKYQHEITTLASGYPLRLVPTSLAIMHRPTSPVSFHSIGGQLDNIISFDLVSVFSIC
ncbi:hypothetical protein Aperf_G00000084022 [Anoplocephala perfoliata]